MDDCPPLGPGGGDSSALSESAGGQQAHLVELRAAVERGLDDIKAGRVEDLDAALGRIEAMLDELEAAKRAAA